MTVKPGEVITFRGCSWHEPGWEFEAPCVLYEPVKRFGSKGSISGNAVVSAVEDVCIDLAVNGEIRDDWHASDLKEFAWRGWNRDGFACRRRAIHAEIVVRFFNLPDGELAFEYVAACEVDACTRKRTPFLRDVPAAAAA